MVGTFLETDPAEQLMRQLRIKGFRTGVLADRRPGASTAYRVVVGQFASTDRALSAKREVQRLMGAPISIIDLSDPANTVGATQFAEGQTARVPAVTRTASPAETVPEVQDDTATTEPADEVTTTQDEVQPETPDTATMSDASKDDLDGDTAPATARVEAATAAKATGPGPDIKSVKVYVRDERLLIFLDGLSDSRHGIAGVEYRVLSSAGDPLSNWSDVSLVPPGRSSYGLQMHRVPLPPGFEAAGAEVEVRAVNAVGNVTKKSASVGAE